MPANIDRLELVASSEEFENFSVLIYIQSLQRVFRDDFIVHSRPAVVLYIDGRYAARFELRQEHLEHPRWTWCCVFWCVQQFHSDASTMKWTLLALFNFRAVNRRFFTSLATTSIDPGTLKTRSKLTMSGISSMVSFDSMMILLKFLSICESLRSSRRWRYGLVGQCFEWIHFYKQNKNY